MGLPQYGWTGKILRVDVGTGVVTRVDTARYAPDWIGGRAMGAKIYWDEVPPDIPAFHPENRLIFAAGPAVGTAAPSANRIFITGKSPVPYPIESYMYSSMGGHWGAELKFAGYDALIIHGRAPKPVYLWIMDGRAEIRDAQPLWGMISRDVQLAIKKIHGDNVRSAVIGPAGEHLCREAIITSDTSFAAGLGGFGAVMGSKNLKAIAVRGTGCVTVARQTELLDLYEHFARLATCKPGEGMRNPVRYMKYYTSSLELAEGQEVDEVDNSAIGEESVNGSVKKRTGSCFACPVGCLFGFEFMDRSIPGGAGCCNENKFALHVEHAYYGGKAVGRSLVEATRLHDDLGLSETQTGFKYEYEWFWQLVKAGILTKENTGLAVDKIGSREFWQAYLHAIAYREGIGDLLAEGEERFFIRLRECLPEGLREAAKGIGDHWLYKGGVGFCGQWGGGKVTTALSILQQTAESRPNMQSRAHLLNPNHKACHLSPAELKQTMKAGALKYFGTEKVLEPHTFEDKVPAAIFLQDFCFISDSVPYCNWIFPKAYSGYTFDHLGDITIGSKIFSTVTGIACDDDEMMKTVGERGTILERMIMVREGRRRRNDWVNQSVFERNREWLSEEMLSQAMEDYYEARGWDRETGIPRREKLESLGLGYLADELERKYGITVPS